jgi:hypothetical protein
MKTVYRPESEFMANTVRDLLEQSGIAAMVHSFQIPAYDGVALVMRPAWGEVLVMEDDWEKAQELVEGFLAAQGPAGQPPDGPGRTRP